MYIGQWKTDESGSKVLYCGLQKFSERERERESLRNMADRQTHVWPGKVPAAQISVNVFCVTRCKLHSVKGRKLTRVFFNPLNAELNPIRHLVALVGARHIVRVSKIRVKDKFVPLSKHRVLKNSQFRPEK